MIFEGEKLKEFKEDIWKLHKLGLGYKVDHMTYFGIIEEEKLVATGALKCYGPIWYMRADVVVPKFRGRGLQRKLIQERMEWLKKVKKEERVRVGIEPWNLHSIKNYEMLGFELKGMRNLKNKNKINLYEIKL